jgi:hypothetical protein
VLTHISPNCRHDPNFLVGCQGSDLLRGRRRILSGKSGKTNIFYRMFFAPDDSRDGSIRAFLGLALSKHNQIIMSIRKLLTRMTQRYAELSTLKNQKMKGNEH